MNKHVKDRQVRQTEYPGAHILVVDDKKEVRRTLTKLLNNTGYRAESVGSGSEAVKYISREEVDLVILDLKMPGMNGTDLLEAASALKPEVIYIILTAYGTLESAIQAIRHGAFDYLIKPSPISQILDTVEAGLQKREQQSQDGKHAVDLLQQALSTLTAHEHPAENTPDPAEERFIQAHGITVDTHKRLVVVNGDRINLTSTEFEILVYMIQKQDRVVTCQEIVRETRGQNLYDYEARRLLRSHIHRLRVKLEPKPDDPTLIQTVWGEGYMLSVPSKEEFQPENSGT
jgi:two-component system KDP operon response regulator KdpE